MASGTCSPVGGALIGGTAPTAFTFAASSAQVASDVVFEWDFDNDGDFDETVEDITSYVLSAESGTGRDYPSSLTGKAGPGKLRLALNNDDDRFSYFNTASPLNTSPFTLQTGRKIRVRTSEQTLGAADISYVGIGAAAIGNNASVAPALPTGLAVGDLMLIHASIRNSGTGTVSYPTGWVPLPDEDGAALVSGNVAILARYYETGDAAPTVTFTGGAANATTIAQCFALRGTHQQLSEVVSNSVAQLNGSAQNIAIAALTVSENNNVVIATGWKQDDWTSVATLSGFTEISDTSSTTGDDAGIVIDYQIQTTATSISSTSFTVTGGASAISRSIILALRPAVDISDPVLLVRDRFARADDNLALGVAETGQTWTTRSNRGYVLYGQCATVPILFDEANTNVDVISTIDTATTDHYVQASIPMQVQDGRVGLIVRYSDTSNYTRVYYSNVDRGVICEDVSGGVVTEIAGPFPVEAWDGMHLGAATVNQQVTVYLGGTPLGTGTIPGTITGTHAGLYGKWQVHSDVQPRVDDFYVWDRVRAPIDGVLWTGTVSDVRTAVSAGDLKVVEITAEGPLAAAAVAAVPAPRIVRTVGESESDNHAVPAGCIVGDIMARAGIAPPHPIDPAPTSVIGPVALSDGAALGLARQIEATARGFILETPEGGVAFQDRDYRDSVAAVAWFTDTPGTGQYGYSSITPLDQRSQIINRVTAGVAATCPTVVAVENQSYGVSSMDIDVVVPDVLAGDLVVVFIVSSGDTTVDWITPLGWDQHSQQGKYQGLRVFSKICDGSESGATVEFYTSSSNGIAIAHIYTIRDWYGVNDGLKLGRAAISTSPGTGEDGENAYPLQAWNRAPALFIVVQEVIGSTAGSILWGPLDTPPPVGYDYLSLEGLVVVSPGTESYEVGIESVYKTDILDTEDPRKWSNVFDDWITQRATCVFAVRGYNGPHGKASIDSPGAIGDDGLWVTVNDLDSQLEHNVVRSNPDEPNLFYTEAHATDYAEDVLATYADDRAIIALSFYASKSAALRTLARNLRVSDLVTVTATGNTGLGISGSFYVESYSHKWSHGTRLWETTLELSPA